MAKNTKRRSGPEKASIYQYPSRYGSHKSMLDEEETQKLNDLKRVALRDENGLYITDGWRLDCGLADPNRYRESRQKRD